MLHSGREDRVATYPAETPWLSCQQNKVDLAIQSNPAGLLPQPLPTSTLTTHIKQMRPCSALVGSRADLMTGRQRILGRSTIAEVVMLTPALRR